MSNTTRGVFSGGRDGAAGVQFSTIDFVTIASLGDATDFGNLTFTGAYGASASSQTRGVTALGRNSPDNLNLINYVTIATAGDAQDSLINETSGNVVTDDSGNNYIVFNGDTSYNSKQYNLS